MKTLLKTIALTFCLCACSEPPRFADTLATHEKIVVLAGDAFDGTFDPRQNTRAWTGKVLGLIFEGLTRIENDSLEPTPALAKRIDAISPTVYEIEIRENARFHNGNPVLSTDVQATLESFKNPALKSPLASQYRRIQKIEILGPRLLRCTLDEPHAPFLSDLSIGILPASSIAPDGSHQGPVIGAGPYKLRERRGTEECVLEASPHYWNGEPATPYLVFRTVFDANTQLLALLAGAADLVQGTVTPRLAFSLGKHAEIEVDTAPGVLYSYIAFNMRDPIVSRPKVRQAIALAIDRERLIHHKYIDTARLAAGMLPEGHWAHSDSETHWPHDPAKARALLDEEGLTAAPGEMRFRLSFKTTTDKFRRTLAKLIAADLEAVGIGLDVLPLESGTLLRDAKSGNFQLFSLLWADPSEPHFYNWIFHSDRIPTPSDPGKGGNRGAYQNARVDELIDQGRISVNRNDRKRIYRELQEIISNDLPYLSLWHENVLVVRRREVQGYKATPNASLFGLWRAYKEKSQK